MNEERICGAIFVNEMGDLAMCVLHEHPPHNGHCDGVDRCDDYCDDPVSDLCEAVGLFDSHGAPTRDYFDLFEGAT